jgi:hypothetical protein
MSSKPKIARSICQRLGKRLNRGSGKKGKAGRRDRVEKERILRQLSDPETLQQLMKEYFKAEEAKQAIWNKMVAKAPELKVCTHFLFPFSSKK